MRLTTTEQIQQAVREIKTLSSYHIIDTEAHRREIKDLIKSQWHERHNDYDPNDCYGYRKHAREVIKLSVKKLRCADYTIAQARRSWVNALVIGYQAASSGTSLKEQRKVFYGHNSEQARGTK